MSAFRALRPALQSSSRLAFRSARPAARRFLNTDTAPALYTAHATVTGARDGHVEGDEGLKIDLAMPEILSGKKNSGKTNPEELFAAGYGACFQSAMNACAPSLGIKLPQDSVVDTKVHLVGSLKELDLGIRVDMKVKVKGITKDELEKVIAKTKEICPYSRATQGNVTTNVEVEVS